jgi:catechol 2,3-dioxygenase-like lactoylglutathione lyase family enzyme
MSPNPTHRIGRREALRLLGAGAFAARITPAEESLHFTALDHLEFFVSDIQKSLALYTRVFGNAVWKNNRTARRYLKLGSTYIALEQGTDPHLDHFCAGIEGFQVANAHSYLAAKNIEYRDYPSGRDLYVSDPDSNRLQIGADNSWIQLSTSTASPEATPLSGEPIFRPVGLDHILLNVSDPARTAAFFEKILGPVSLRSNSGIWFQAGRSRIGLVQAAGGQKPGMNRFGVTASPFDYEMTAKLLQTAGARFETPAVAGAPQFRDPDGFLIQVTSARAN